MPGPDSSIAVSLGLGRLGNQVNIQPINFSLGVLKLKLDARLDTNVIDLFLKSMNLFDKLLNKSLKKQMAIIMRTYEI